MIESDNMNHGGLKLVTLEGPRGENFLNRHPGKDELLIGRNDEVKELDLSIDRELSCEHARMFCERDGWYIENLQKPSQTMVEGDKLIGCMELHIGNMVHMGNTLFTLIAKNQFCFYFNGVFAYGQHYPVINYAFLCSRLKFIRKLILKNTSRAKTKPFHIELSIGWFGRCSLDIPALAGYEEQEINVPDIKYYPSELKDISEGTAAFSIVAGDTSLYRTELQVLNQYEWSYELYRPELISVYVPSENNPVIQTIIRKAAEKSEYDSSDSVCRNKVISAVFKIYNYLRDNCNIEYVAPKTGRNTLQMIRPPQHIFGVNIQKLSGIGTCLDLSLLMAGCLESKGIAPVIIFSGDKEGNPLHVFLGFWTGFLKSSKLLLGEKEIKSLTMLECTGFADNCAADGKKNFEDAVKVAEKIFAESNWKQGVNISAARGKPYHMVSVDFELEPEVSHIYREALNYAKRKGSRKIGTGHLFYAIVSSGKSATVRLFSEAGLNRGYVAQKIDNEISTRDYRVIPGKSENLLVIEGIAEQNARKYGAFAVREQDLLFAFLKHYKDSRDFQVLLSRLEINMEALLEILKRQYGFSGDYTTGYSRSHS